MMPNFLRRILRVEILGPVLILVALQMLTYGIASSLRATDTRYLFGICLVAAGLGWLLSRSRLNGINSTILIVILGWISLWIVAARLALPLFDLLQALTAQIPQLAQAVQEKVPPDTTALRAAWSVVDIASSALGSRWQLWLSGIAQGTNVNDGLIRNMIWSFVIWCLAAWTGWFAARRNAVLSLLPSIVLMAFVLSYSEYRVYSLWFIVIIMLLLMGMWNYKNHTIQWEHHRVDYSDSILYDNTQAVIFLALLVGTLAFSMPSLSWQSIRDAIQDRNSNKAAEVLGIREQSTPRKNATEQKPSMPREHLLTEGFAQSQELVMTIRTGELSPAPIPSLAQQAPRYYWRGNVYDEYVGAGWVTSSATPQRYRANTPLVPGLLDGYRSLHLDVHLQQPEGKLFWSGILFSADVPFRADWRVRPQSDLFADQTALLQADLFAAASGATSYEAEAYIPDVTVEELRSAPAEYPDELLKRYTRLPPELPERVRRLADEITAGKENPYEKAKAIESYLRTNYPYDLDIPAPPVNQDVTDYFLFDLQRGYCDYYATAMVVLARASGLPARFVSGYSPGSYDGLNAQYVIREMNAHSWPEIYFPDIGWIEFEPTASQPVIERVEKPITTTIVEPPPSPTEKFFFQLTTTGILYWLLPLALVLFFLGSYFFLFEKAWILRREPVNAISSLFRKYYRLGRPLAGKRTHAETASEFTYKLIHNLEQIHNHSPSTNSFKEDAQQFTNVYLLSLFSNHSIGKEEAGKAFDSWKRLRRQLLAARLNRYVVRKIRKPLAERS